MNDVTLNAFQDSISMLLMSISLHKFVLGSHHFENFVAIQSQEFFGKLNYWNIENYLVMQHCWKIATNQNKFNEGMEV